MKIRPTTISGAYWIEPEPYTDERGLFRRHLCMKELAEAGISFEVKQTNVSENHSKYTLRGFHSQRPPHGEAKILSVMRGAVHDVLLDIRADSPTFGKWQSFTLSAENRCLLLVPLGCANAFLTLEDDTWVHYYHSGFYEPGAENNVRWNDPAFQFDWPCPPAVISRKDAEIPNWKPAPAASSNPASTP